MEETGISSREHLPDFGENLFSRNGFDASHSHILQTSLDFFRPFPSMIGVLNRMQAPNQFFGEISAGGGGKLQRLAFKLFDGQSHIWKLPGTGLKFKV
ncbi:MAG: hypothetical protein ABI162_02715 [Luteolibacter sp.]